MKKILIFSCILAVTACSKQAKHSVEYYEGNRTDRLMMMNECRKGVSNEKEWKEKTELGSGDCHNAWKAIRNIREKEADKIRKIVEQNKANRPAWLKTE